MIVSGRGPNSNFGENHRKKIDLLKKKLENVQAKINKEIV